MPKIYAKLHRTDFMYVSFFRDTFQFQVNQEGIPLRTILNIQLNGNPKKISKRPKYLLYYKAPVCFKPHPSPLLQKKVIFYINEQVEKL